MYIQSIKSGKDYSTAEKSMAILVSDYELDSLKNVKIMSVFVPSIGTFK